MAERTAAGALPPVIGPCFGKGLFPLGRARLRRAGAPRRAACLHWLAGKVLRAARTAARGPAAGRRQAARAGLLLFGLSAGEAALAQDVTLTSLDGAVEVSGDLLGFDGTFYRVGTEFGELSLDGSGVTCAGPGCPDLAHFVAGIDFAGSRSLAAGLMPGLIAGFAAENGLALRRLERGPDTTVYELSRDGRLAARFGVRAATADAGFEALLAGRAGILMAQRELTEEERARAKAAGLGDPGAPGRSRVAALDALVPLAAPDASVQAIGDADLLRVLAGEIANWSALGGPDAPVALHLPAPETALAQVLARRVPTLAGLDAPRVQYHADAAALARSVAADPFALGAGSLAAAGPARVLPVSGACGHVLAPDRWAVKAGDYPLAAPLFLYLPARRLPKTGRAFLAYLRSPAAQAAVRAAGYVDQGAATLPIGAQGTRLANAIRAAGGADGLAALKRVADRLSGLKRLSLTFRFEAGSARPDAQSRENAARLARAIEAGAYDGRELLFAGFSDGQGPAGANLEIAAERADAVRKLVEQAAETADLGRIRIGSEAFGEALPMACDDSAWGRQVNRRVEVWVD